MSHFCFLVTFGLKFRHHLWPIMESKLEKRVSKMSIFWCFLSWFLEIMTYYVTNQLKFRCWKMVISCWFWQNIQCIDKFDGSRGSKLSNLPFLTFVQLLEISLFSKSRGSNLPKMTFWALNWHFGLLKLTFWASNWHFELQNWHFGSKIK